MHGEMLINGHFIGGPCDQSVGKAVIRSPWDGRVIGTAAEGDLLMLRNAVDSAHAAFDSWRLSTFDERAELLQKMSKLITERREELAQLLVDEIGKPITLALAEADRTALTFGLAAKVAADQAPVEIDLSYDSRGKDFSAQTSRAPLGIILAIVPYNWPYNLTAHKVAPALAAGNTLVIKPSPKALLSTYALGRLLHEAGFPAGVLNVVDAPNRAVETVLADPRLAMVSFTGSDAVGWKLKSSLPPQTRCTLELGGDAFVIVDADADIPTAAKLIAAGAFNYAGQICISVQHVLAHEAIYEELKRALITETQDFPTGDPADPEVKCGPMIDAIAVQKVEVMIREAKASGASALVEGSSIGTLLPPTLLEGVPLDSALGSQEAFGPVLTLSKFESLTDAAKRVTQSRYGLQLGVFTNQSNTVEQLVVQIPIGTVIVNDVPTTRFDALPYGGIKQSGFGTEGVTVAFEEMTRHQVLINRK